MQRVEAINEKLGNEDYSWYYKRKFFSFQIEIINFIFLANSNIKLYFPLFF